MWLHMGSSLHSPSVESRYAINQQRTVNMQMRYLIIQMFVLKSQGYFKKIY